MVVSGVSVRRKVSPGWPVLPPVFLPDRSRRLLTRAGFFSPSLDGGLPLLPLFSPSWRSNSAIRARNAVISAVWRASCPSSSAIRSPFGNWLSSARSIGFLNRQTRPSSNEIYPDFVATRSPLLPPLVVTGIPLAVTHLGSYDK